MSETDLLIDRFRSLYGLVVHPAKSEQLESAISRLAAEHRCARDVMARRLQSDRALLRDLASAVTVEETFFFRQTGHFEYLVRVMRRHQLPRPFRVLCAGCASGAEAYSLIIAIREAGLRVADVEVVACDVSRSAIEQARSGQYSAWMLRETPQAIRDRYFNRDSGGDWHLVAEIRDAVVFHHCSIQEHLCGIPPRTYDAILCRNVAVYLHPEAQERLYANLARALIADGRLFLAPTDPRPPAKLLVRTGDTEPAIFASAAAIRRPSATRHTVRPTRGDAARSSQPVRPTIAAELDEIRALADRGEHAEALRRIESVCRVRPAEARLHLLRGQLYLAAERWQDSVEAIGRSVRADPVDPIARYWLVLALRDAGHYVEALAEANALKAALEKLPVRARLRSEGITAQEIRQAVSQLEEELR
jgi:chemotaxis protein methyltransferase CheR